MTRGRLLASRAGVADAFLARAIGLIGRSGWSGTDGLVLEPCGAVHSLCLRMPIDVLFVGPDGRVLHARSGMPPWRLGWPVRDARSVVELPDGTIARTSTEAGDVIARRPVRVRGAGVRT